MHNNLVLVPGAKLRRVLTFDVGDPRLVCRAFLQLGVLDLTRLVSETDIAQGLKIVLQRVGKSFFDTSVERP